VLRVCTGLELDVTLTVLLTTFVRVGVNVIRGVFVKTGDRVYVVEVDVVFDTLIEAVYVGLVVDVFEGCSVFVCVRL
jgi:hypothetical protein